MLERMLSENHGDRYITCVASVSDQDATNPTSVMSRIESMPVCSQVNFDPGAEIHGIGVDRNPNVAEIASGIARRDIHAATQGDRKMRKVAADADALAKGIKGSAVGAGLQVVETEMAVDEIANRL